MSLDLDAVRADFPALTTPDAHGQLPLFLDGPGGAQVPQQVLDAVVAYLGHYNSNLGGYADAGVRTTDLVAQARAAASDLLGRSGENVVFGPNSTTLMFNLSRSVARTWRPGDNIVVSELDHYSNVSSWALAAQDAGVEVRVLPLDAAASDLDYAHPDALVDDRTRLIAVTAASNLIGTIPDLPRIITRAREVGALVSIDAVHAAVHRRIDADDLDADFLFSSAYKLGGPHLGMCIAKTEHLTQLTPYKVEPATNDAPARWEQGTQSFEALAGFVALVDYWASFGVGDDRRARLASAYEAIGAHERMLKEALLAGFLARPRVRLHGLTTIEGRTPTFAFSLVAADEQAAVRALGERNIAVGLGNFYALGAVRRLGVEGVLRIGCAHYTTLDEVTRFFAALDDAMA